MEIPSVAPGHTEWPKTQNSVHDNQIVLSSWVRMGLGLINMHGCSLVSFVSTSNCSAPNSWKEGLFWSFALNIPFLREIRKDFLAERRTNVSASACRKGIFSVITHSLTFLLILQVQYFHDSVWNPGNGAVETGTSSSCEFPRLHSFCFWVRK